jgi:bla regulator protein BlaR1
MQTIIHNLSEALGTTIIQSLMQGVLVYLILRITLLAFPQIRSNYKYLLSVGALLALFAWFTAGLFTMLLSQDWTTHLAKQPLTSVFLISSDLFRETPQSFDRFYSISLQAYLPYISVLYVAGLFLRLLRVGWSRQQINRLKQSFVYHEALTRQVAQLAQRFDISKPVCAGLSSLVSVPCVAGNIKPLLFFPITALSHLSAQEVEAIILHELAHIKRNDYLINYIQQVISALLFFNPFATLINRLINTEREHCCDDMVINLTSQPLPYAQALLKLQEMQPQYALAMAAKSSNFKLLNRIQRIMKTENPHHNLRHLVFALVLLTASAFSIAWFNPEFKNGKLTVKLKQQSRVEMPTVYAEKNNLSNSHKNLSVLHALKNASNFTSNDTSRFQDTLLERLANRLEDLDEQRQAVLDRPEYKTLVFTLAEKNKIIAAYYSRPEIEQKIKQLPTDHYQLSDSLDAASNVMWATYLKDNFRDQEKELLRKHGIYKGYDNYTNHKNWEHYKAEWENYKKAKLKNESAELDKVSAKLRTYIDSKEFEKKNITRAQSDSLHAIYDTPEILQTKKEIAQLKAQIKALENGTERQTFSKEIFKLSDSINTRLKSSELKQRLYTFMKTHPNQIDITKWAH